MRAWLALAAGLAIFAQIPVGCSSSSSNSGSEVQKPQLYGAYRGSGGDIQEINFYDASHYFLWRSPCAPGEEPVPESTECREDGTYVLSADRSQLSLTNAANGQTVTLPFKVLGTSDGSSVQSFADPVQTWGLVGGDGGLTSGDGGLLNDGGACDGGLVNLDGGGLTSMDGGGAGIITGFQAGGQQFQNNVVDGVDYSFSRPAPAALRANGYTFAARYLSRSSGKNLTADEAKQLGAAGLDIVVVWESTANAALGGNAAGVSAATSAQSLATAAGMPAGRPIYFAVDFDATQAQQSAINDYFDGVASVLGADRTGAYGGYHVIQRLFDAGKITWGWQTYAWSGGQWDARAQLRQIQNDTTVAGASVDLDQGVSADFGQWRPDANCSDAGADGASP